jgi:hypothetical protein
MNRQQRRKARVFEYKTISRSEFDAMDTVCAWEGCWKTFAGDMPKGWVWLLAYWSECPKLAIDDSIPIQDWLQDTTLCPEHARALDLQLKDIPRLQGAAAGEA